MSYNAFAQTFSASRKNLRWGEIEYFVKYIQERFLNKEISLFDVGCGNGRLLETLEKWKFPFEYLGIDESSGMIEEARKLHTENTFRVLDMNHLWELSDDEKYNVIAFIASFHHLQTSEERMKVLQKIKKLLTPDGVIMMTNWNLLGEELFPKYEKSYKWNGDFDIKIGNYKRYYHGFTTEELGDLFYESGFQVIENRVFEDGRNIVSIISV